jgi:YidC/Oxa1 family membrane protein insertase
MFQALAGLLSLFYDLVPNYAIAISLLTITVMLVLTPLTWKSTRSMLEMQRLQPEIKRLQAEHKNDRAKLNEAMMAFYKEHNVNPAASCLPLLLQMPVFFIMFRVISGLSKTVLIGATVVGGTGTGSLVGATVTGGTISGSEIVTVAPASGGPAVARLKDGTLKNPQVKVGDQVVGVIKSAKIKDGRVDRAEVVAVGTGTKVGDITGIVVEGGRIEGRPQYISKSSAMYKDLAESGGQMEAFGVDLARAASSKHSNFWEAFPYFLLVGLVVAAQYVQTKQSTGRNPAAAQNPQMVMMQRVMPAFFGFISFTIHAGVNVYFLVSALFRIAQQELMYRYDPVLAAHVREQVKEVEAKAYEKKGKAEPPGKGDVKPATGKNKGGEAGRGPGRAGGGNGNGNSQPRRPNTPSKNARRTKRGR